MSNPTNNDPVQETVVVDGNELTEQESALIAAGLDPERNEAEERAAAERAEQERLQQEQEAETRRQQEEAEATAARQREEEAAAAAARQPAPAPVIPEAVAKPEAPKDFEAEFVALDQKITDAQAKFDRGEIEADDLATIVREANAEIRQATRAEAAYTAQLAAWEHSEQARARAIESAQEATTRDWNAAALAWEKTNADFLANPLRAEAMQKAIAAVDAKAQEEKRYLSPVELLAEAGKLAMEAFNYTPAAGTNVQEEVRKAVGDRTEKLPAANLGDVPNAGNEAIKGNEAYGRLDGMPIQDLEETVSRMTPEALEAYLADAPGAKAHGRD